ncbi:MAG: hypothetical protein ACRCYU_15035 [Nocardioides sp.]
MERTTIAIHPETRARIRAGAQGESKTMDAFLRSVLDEYDQARFWGSFVDVTPQVYSAATVADGDGLDEGYPAEDRALDA